MKSALSQGFGYALFVFLFLYVLKTTGEREKNYQNIIENLTEKFGVLDDIKKSVDKIEEKIFK